MVYTLINRNQRESVWDLTGCVAVVYPCPGRKGGVEWFRKLRCQRPCTWLCYFESGTALRKSAYPPDMSDLGSL